MMTKLKIKGLNSGKYMLIYYLFTILLIVVYTIYAFLPFGKEFLILLQNSLNSHHWELLTLFIPILKMILYAFLLGIVQFLFALFLYFNYKSKYL